MRSASEPRRADALVGRARELAVLRLALDDVAERAGRLMLVVGEPGIGKTRLAQEIAGGALAAGHAVAWGAAWKLTAHRRTGAVSTDCRNFLEAAAIVGRHFSLAVVAAALGTSGADLLDADEAIGYGLIDQAGNDIQSSRVVAVWESKQHADRFLEERLAPALATAFDEPQGRRQVLQGEVANLYTA